MYPARKLKTCNTEAERRRSSIWSCSYLLTCKTQFFIVRRWVRIGALKLNIRMKRLFHPKQNKQKHIFKCLYLDLWKVLKAFKQTSVWTVLTTFHWRNSPYIHGVDYSEPLNVSGKIFQSYELDKHNFIHSHSFMMEAEMSETNISGQSIFLSIYIFVNFTRTNSHYWFTSFFITNTKEVLISHLCGSSVCCMLIISSERFSLVFRQIHFGN